MENIFKFTKMFLMKNAIKSYSENGAKVRDDLSSMANGARNGAQKIRNIF